MIGCVYKQLYISLKLPFKRGKIEHAYLIQLLFIENKG